MGKKIIQFVLALVVLGLAYYVYVLISTPIKFENEQKVREAAVIERIKDIRTAERTFKSKYQRFTGDFGPPCSLWMSSCRQVRRLSEAFSCLRYPHIPEEPS